MKSQPISTLFLRAAFGAICLAGTASAQPGHPGHDFGSAAHVPDNGKLILAVAVTALALLASHGVYKKLP